MDYITASQKYQNRADADRFIYIDNLHKFSVQLGFISSLTAAGKLSVAESSERVEQLYQEFSISKEQSISTPDSTSAALADSDLKTGLFVKLEEGEYGYQFANKHKNR